ncbi:MAG: SusC/RagA family TonB-linked outer membrane protein [Weeksellaceae bacterium]|nr:SusC/RagA family TonB-linked outer membrane protein [Weeksellaceae bacterium]
MLLLFVTLFVWAQQKVISGRVTDSDGFPVQDAYVTVVGTDRGVYTDADGNYSITVNQGETLSIEYIGMDSQTVVVGAGDRYNVAMASGGIVELGTVVSTALGIEREKRSLGYAAQQVDGDLLSASRGNNALASLSGNVAGAQISAPSGNLGGSTRIILRGAGSVLGENRPLIVVDGIPMANSNFNTTNAQRGAGGRDYGDGMFDINPDDIESYTVLKGGPAAALYGERGANGVIMITTKKGRKGRDEVVLNSGVSFESISLWPRMQNMYGGGSSDSFQSVNINGTDYNIVEYSMDESWGPRYNPNISVLHWDAFDPEFPADYLRPRPWVAPESDSRDFFNIGVAYNNSVAFSKSFDRTLARVSLSHVDATGIQPNSNLKRTTAGLSIGTQLFDNLSVTSDLNYSRTDGFNRPEVGYGNNSVMQKFVQWGQRQLDMNRLRNYMLPNGAQRTWNRQAWNNPAPQYSNNPYWSAYQNTADDLRNRFYGNVKLRYDLGMIEGLYATGAVYADMYDLRIRERVAVGSQELSRFYQAQRNFTEMNYEARLHYDRNYGDVSVNSFVGGNLRNNKFSNLIGQTVGGLVVPGIYNLANSVSQATVTNFLEEFQTNSVFAMLSLGYMNTFFIEGTARNDWSSTLPQANNSYFYPSVTASFVFSELVDSPWLNFGKLRGGFAEVGSATNPYNTSDVFLAGLNFLGNPSFGLPTTRANSNLRPERKKTWEVGLEMSFLQNRLGFDVTYYDEQTYDLILSSETSYTTGYNAMWLNAGTLRNKGIEALVNVVPVRTEDFDWTVTWNFAKNDNIVEDLYGDMESVSLVNAPFRAQLWAVKGERYGQIRGTDFVYDDAGNKVVGANGLYLQSPVTNLGSIIPDYNMGIRNTFRYKNVRLSALIDIQKGGNYFSVSNMFGHYSGMLEATAENGVRENGVVAEGVRGTVTYAEDGSYTVTDTSVNTINVPASTYFSHYYSGPVAQNVFDASYVKLRDVTLSYTIPKRLVNMFEAVEFTVFGRNLLIWGLDNPSFDPEMATAGSGNIQGLEGGNLPPTRAYGLNVKLHF